MPKEVNGDHDNQDEAPAVVESGRAWLPPKDQKPRVDHGVAPVNHCMQMNLESQSWAYVDATQFQVRGANYLSDKIKQPSKQNAFELVEVSGFSTLGKCMFSTERPDSFFSRARMMGRKNFIFTMHFNLDPMHVVMVYELNGDALEKDTAFANCFNRFLQGDEAYKNGRLKLITSVVDASWIVKRTIGKPVPALIGNKLMCHYRQTEDMIECTCDVNSSMAAKAIVSVVKSACKGIVCDLVILIEGRQEDELPERIIGSTRYVRHDLSKYPFVDKDKA